MEAARLLKEFWAAVEKGLEAKKGQFLAVAGAGGSIVSVQDGIITLKGPRGEEQRPIQKLAAKQAIAYADLSDGEHSNLIKGTFLLAEGEGLDEAEKLLVAAGNPPGLAFYKDRLAALTFSAAELAARNAWGTSQVLEVGMIGYGASEASQGGTH